MSPVNVSFMKLLGKTLSSGLAGGLRLHGGFRAELGSSVPSDGGIRSDLSLQIGHSCNISC